MRIVVTLVTSLLPQLLVFQVVLQGGNGNKGKKLYVKHNVMAVALWKLFAFFCNKVYEKRGGKVKKRHH